MAKLKITKASATVILWTLVGLLWEPVFIASWLLRIVARFLLSISYFGMLNGKMGSDVFKSLFTWYDTKI